MVSAAAAAAVVCCPGSESENCVLRGACVCVYTCRVNAQFPFSAMQEGTGVGDDAVSWAFDPARKCLWHNAGQRAWGVFWAPGDVVGCGVTLLADGSGTMIFSVNGRLVSPGRPAFSLPPGTLSTVRAAASVDRDVVIGMRFGGAFGELLHLPDGYSGVGDAVVAAAPSAAAAAATVTRPPPNRMASSPVAEFVVPPLDRSAAAPLHRADVPPPSIPPVIGRAPPVAATSPVASEGGGGGGGAGHRAYDVVLAPTTPPAAPAAAMALRSAPSSSSSAGSTAADAVVNFFARLELPYAAVMVDNGFDSLKALDEISDDDLISLGVSKLGHRRLILRELERRHADALDASSGKTPSSASPSPAATPAGDDGGEAFAAVALEVPGISTIPSGDLEMQSTPIGKGSFGTVFRGRWRGSDIAVKVLHTQCASSTSDMRREIESMACLKRHPNVVCLVGTSWVRAVHACCEHAIGQAAFVRGC